MIIHPKLETAKAIALDCSDRTRSLEVAVSMFAGRHGNDVIGYISASKDPNTTRAAKALIATFKAGLDWTAETRTDARVVSRALRLIAARNSAVAGRASWLHERILALQEQDSRLRKLRKLRGLIPPRRQLFPTPVPRRRA